MWPRRLAAVFVAVVVAVAMVAGLCAASPGPWPTLQDAMVPGWSATVTEVFATSNPFDFAWSTSASQGATYQRIGPQDPSPRINIAVAGSAGQSNGLLETCFGFHVCYCSKTQVTYPGPLGFTGLSVNARLPTMMNYTATDGNGNYVYAFSYLSPMSGDTNDYVMVVTPEQIPVSFINNVTMAGTSEPITTASFVFADVDLTDPPSSVFSLPCTHSS